MMRYNFKSMYRYIFENNIANACEAKLTIEQQIAKEKRLQNTLRDFFLNNDIGIFSGKAAEHLSSFRYMLRHYSTATQYLENVLFKNNTDELKPETVFPTDSFIAALFDKIEAEKQIFPQDQVAAVKENFIKLYKLVKIIGDWIERVRGVNAAFITYKILVIVNPSDKNLFETLDHYFNQFVYSYNYEKPLFRDLFPKLKLPESDDSNYFVSERIHLKAWQALNMEGGTKVWKYLSHASIIEQHYKRVPSSLKEAKEAYILTYFKRAAENLPLAELCAEYTLDESTFNKCLAILEERALQEQESKQTYKNYLPDVVINGAKVGHAGYFLVKLPENDLRGFIIGKMTGCCQYIGGTAGMLAEDSMKRKSNGLYVLIRIKKPTSAEVSPFVIQEGIKKINNAYEIVGQGIGWLTLQGNLVIDSFETKTPGRDNPVVEKILTLLGEAITHFEDIDIVRVTIGLGGGTPRKVFSKISAHEIEIMRESYNNYGDSAQQGEIFCNPVLRERNVKELSSALRELKSLEGKTLTAEKNQLLRYSQYISLHFYLNRIKPHLADLLLTFSQIKTKLSPQNHSFIIRLFLDLKEAELYADENIRNCILFEICKPSQPYGDYEFARSIQLLEELVVLKKSGIFGYEDIRAAMLKRAERMVKPLEGIANTFKQAWACLQEHKLDEQADLRAAFLQFLSYPANDYFSFIADWSALCSAHMDKTLEVRRAFLKHPYDTYQSLIKPLQLLQEEKLFDDVVLRNVVIKAGLRASQQKTLSSLPSEIQDLITVAKSLIAAKRWEGLSPCAKENYLLTRILKTELATHSRLFKVAPMRESATSVSNVLKPN